MGWWRPFKLLYNKLELPNKFVEESSPIYPPIIPPIVPNLQNLWETLHENVICFIKRFRFEVDKRSIRDKFNKIEIIAYEKKNETVSDIFDYNFMIDEYIDMYEEYNRAVSIFKQTYFLKHI